MSDVELPSPDTCAGRKTLALTASSSIVFICTKALGHDGEHAFNDVDAIKAMEADSEVQS